MATLGFRPDITTVQAGFAQGLEGIVFARQYEVPDPGAVLTGFGAITTNAGGLRLGLYANGTAASAEAPGELLAYSATFTATSPNNSTLAERTLAVAWTKTGNAKLVIPPGKIWIARYTTAANLVMGQSPEPVSTIIRGNYAGPTLPNPWVFRDQAGGPREATWIEYNPNSAPAIASATPADGATVTGVYPGFTLSYTDSDLSNGDGIVQARFALTDSVTGAQQVRLAPVTGISQTNGSIAWTWDGDALVRGRSYTWSATVQDRCGLFSNTLPLRTLTVSSVTPGEIDMTSASPTGKQDPASPLYATGFVGRWTHPSGTAMATLQLQLLIAGIVNQTSPEISRTTANGASWSAVTLTQAGFTGLVPGTAYTWRARGKTSGGDWSDWSEQAAFSINSPASTPSQLYPYGQTVTSLPIRLKWRCSDPDQDDVPGVDVWGEVSVYNSNGQLVASLTNISTIDPNDLTMMYVDLTGTQITASGGYTWMARNWDRSAGSSGYSAWSATAAFTYAAAPAVTITSATPSTATTLAPSITFQVTGANIAQYEILVAEYLNEGQPFFSSGPITATGNPSTASYAMPVGWLANNAQYSVQANVVATSGLNGASSWKAITTALPAAEPLDGVGLNAIANRRDLDQTSVRIGWNATSIPANRFEGYAIWRGAASGRPLVVIRDAGRTSWVDHHAPGNRNLSYSIVQLRRSNDGKDVLQSNPQTFAARVELRTPVLVSVTDPVNVRAALAWMTDGLTWGFERPAQTYTTWGSEGKPIAVTAPVNYGQRTAEVTVTVRSDSRGTLDQHFGDIEDAAVSGHVFTFREGDNRMFCRIANWTASRAGVGMREVRLELEEVEYTEGVALPR